MAAKDDFDMLIDELAADDPELALRVQANLERRELARKSVDKADVRSPRLSSQAYLKHVEELANLVVEKASEEGWLTYLPEDDGQTPLQRAIN